jgi:hypothetical protein
MPGWELGDQLPMIYRELDNLRAFCLQFVPSSGQRLERPPELPTTPFLGPLGAFQLSIAIAG